MNSWKALAILSIIALQFMLIYPYISEPANALFTNLASSIGFSSDDFSFSVGGLSPSDSSSHEVLEYRAKVIAYRDRLSTLLEYGMVPLVIADEVRSFLETLTDEKINSMDITELKMTKEKLEYYIKASGSYEDPSSDDDYYISLDVNTLRYKINKELHEVAEYRIKAEIYGVLSAIEKLDQAEQLLNEALNMVNGDNVDSSVIKAAWGKYFEAKMLVESAEHQIEYLYDD